MLSHCVIGWLVVVVLKLLPEAFFVSRQIETQPHEGLQGPFKAEL